MLVHIKHGATTHDLQMAADCTTQQLQEQIQTATGVFVRQQKLIHKGKVLDSSKRLADQGVKDGATIMLLAAQGGLATKGQQAASTASQLKAAEAKARLEASFAAARGGHATPAKTPGAQGPAAGNGNGVVTHLPERQRAWRATGLITLRELALADLPHRLLIPLNPSHATPTPGNPPAASTDTSVTSNAASTAQHDMSDNQARAQGSQAAGTSSCPLPESTGAAGSPSASAASAILAQLDLAVVEAWRAWSACARGLDVCHNRLTTLPAAICALTSLASLRASHNPLPDTGCPWPSLACLTGLTLLALDHTHLTHVPAGVLDGFSQLRSLSLAGCRLEGTLPEGIGALVSLEVLDLATNRLEALPDELGRCSRLTDLNASDNAIATIPQTLAACSALQTLRLDRNRIGAVPAGLLRGATSLWLLSLTGNPISLDQLRATEGYAELDQRRKSRADKQIDNAVMLHGSSAFAEGADVQQWSHWQMDAKR